MKIKKFLSIIALLCCLLFILLGASYALAEELQPQTDNNAADAFLNTYHDVDFSIPDYERPDDTVDLADELPASYDSRTVDNVTSVKDQNPYGSCWAFAATCAAESSLLATNSTINGGEIITKDSLDLSELQLAYFFYNYDANYLTNNLAYHKQTAADPLGLTAGDETKALQEDYLNQGGSNAYTVWALASWLGGVKETTLPYSTAFPDLIVDDSFAYNNAAAHMQNAYMVNFNNPTEIKQLVKNYGAVAMSYYHSDIYFNNETNAYYQTKNGTNHAVCIIGWDDNYNKSNFNANCQPQKNGAWLIKNSWGDWGTNDGCFWLSYEDGSIQGCLAYAFVFEDAANYDYNYQYDGADDYRTKEISQDGYAANVFTVQGSQQQRIDAVSIGLHSANVDYTVSIYELADAASQPNTGKLLTTQTGLSSYTGYYTIKLDQTVVLQPGNIYSVVFKFNNAATSVFYDTTYSNMGWISFTSSSKPHQSYYISDGSEWTDFSEENNNFRIKAFSNNVAGVSLDLSDLESSNNSGYIRLNHNYATNLTALNNTTLPLSISVTMGETALTSNSAAASYYSYDPETGALTVNNVTDNLSITAQAVSKYTVTAQINNSSFGTVSVKNHVITAKLNENFVYADPAYSIVSSTGNITVEQTGDRFFVNTAADCTIMINAAAPDPTPAAKNVEISEPNPSLTFEDRYVLTSELTAGEYLILDDSDTNLFYYSIEPVINQADDYSAEYASLNDYYSESYQKWSAISAESGYYLQLNGQYLYCYKNQEGQYNYMLDSTNKSVFTLQNSEWGSSLRVVSITEKNVSLSIGKIYQKQNVPLGDLRVTNNYAINIQSNSNDVSGTNVPVTGGQALELTAQLTKPTAATDAAVTWNMFYSDCGMTVNNNGKVSIPVAGGMGIIKATGSFKYDGADYTVSNYVRLTASARAMEAQNIAFTAEASTVSLDLFVPSQAAAATICVAVYNQEQLIGTKTINQAAATAYEDVLDIACDSKPDTLKVFVMQTDSLAPLLDNLKETIS